MKIEYGLLIITGVCFFSLAALDISRGEWLKFISDVSCVALIIWCGLLLRENEELMDLVRGGK